MTDSDISVRSSCIFTDEQIRNVVRRQIDLAINVRRSTSRAQLATDSGVNIHTLDAVLSRDPAKKRRVATEDAFSLCYALGDDAIRALFSILGWTGRPMDDPNHISPAQIVADGLADFSIIAAAAADGRIDHTEVEPCRRAADHLIATVLPLSSAGGKA